MENFFNWVTKPVSNDDVELWFGINNIIPEKAELFYDFCLSLYVLMTKTYLGDENASNETRILINDDDKKKHFKWCWNSTINNFKKENINFNIDGEHYDYFLTFFMEIFYNQENKEVRKSIEPFIRELFDKEKTFTKSDLELYTEIYKLLDKNIIQ